MTSVPLNDDDPEDPGNLRPNHREPPRGLKDLKAVNKNPRDDLIQRLSSSRTANNSSNPDRKTVSQGNVFDRLSTNSNSGSR